MAINGRGRPTRANVEKLKELYFAGKSINEIAKELGIAHQTVSGLCLRRGWKRSSSVKSKLIRKAKIGSRNPMWGGDNIKYGAVHSYIRRRFKQPKKCQLCKVENKKLDLANISGLYKRDIEDWVFLCRQCHMRLDGRFSYRDNAGKYIKGEYKALNI